MTARLVAVQNKKQCSSHSKYAQFSPQWFSRYLRKLPGNSSMHRPKTI